LVVYSRITSVDAVVRENKSALVDPACMVCHMVLDTSGSAKEGTIST
jgi:hypothetical protein